ncbi:exodeoxyribonuclease III [Kushneria indalinina]|uniref:Exodeoxyribonuclease III n=1 Tax=Kushneria indalinina DSM 14324 TaxID=1122140 RepID=A0A3D9E0N4_9GAMM|nr:exodeoxyribonuclease III [Kushneria indalinina]REC96099.1 exodeoxyribonuclease III [Kushneria indalinina DSM 14324]
MRLVSFNINGIRARQHQLEALVETHAPDVIGLQETKVQDSEFPLDAVAGLGYHVHYHGQKGHYGVALLTKSAPTQVQLGFTDDGEDAQRRMIAVTLDTPAGPLTVYNGYFPQGESIHHPTKFPNKRHFYDQLSRHLEQTHHSDELIAIMGDFNISPADIDIGIGEPARKRWLREGKTSFQPEERSWLERLTTWGLEDSYRRCYPQRDDLFSWFDYRSKGFERDPRRGLRIDYILTSTGLSPRVQDAGIDYDLRAMTKPSDHAPVWTTLSVK